MSGLIRNSITLIFALLSRNRFGIQSSVSCGFLVTPFDCGVSVLKSDKYFQLAESAQLDFLVKTKLLGKLKSDGLSFVNASQLIKFMKPIKVFKYARVETKIIFADEKFAYFSHSIFVDQTQHSEVLVKMKFKRGSLTVAPAEVIGEYEMKKPPFLRPWSEMLESMS